MSQVEYLHYAESGTIAGGVPLACLPGNISLVLSNRPKIIETIKQSAVPDYSDIQAVLIVLG